MPETREQWKARIGNGPAISASATPTRESESSGQWERMARWEKEHDATRELAKKGVKVDNLREAPGKLKALGG